MDIDILLRHRSQATYRRPTLSQNACCLMGAARSHVVPRHVPRALNGRSAGWSVRGARVGHFRYF